MSPAAWIEMLQRIEPDLNITCMYESQVSGLFNVKPTPEAITEPIELGIARICVKSFPPQDYIQPKT